MHGAHIEADGKELIAPSSVFCLRGSNERTALRSALAGDVPAMKRLYWHFLGCNENQQLAFYWGMRAADLCDVDMQDEIEQWIRGFRDDRLALALHEIKARWRKSCAG
jgi:hypothetical protein